MYINKIGIKSLFRWFSKKNIKIEQNNRDGSANATQSGFANKQTVTVVKSSSQKQRDDNEKALEKFRAFKKILNVWFQERKSEKKYAESVSKVFDALDDLIFALNFLEESHKVAEWLPTLKELHSILKPESKFFSVGNRMSEFFSQLDTEWYDRNNSEFEILENLEKALVELCKEGRKKD